jgi:hypothetical protein
MGRIEEIGKEGICSECEEKKLIVGSWESEVFCKDCFDKETRKRTEKD